MRHDALKLSRRLRSAFYAGFGALFVTGLGWLLLHTFAQHETEFGAEPHAAEPWLLRLHGAAAMLVLVVLGAMLPTHLQRGWRAHLNRRSGTMIAAGCGVLVVTGYALYYAGGDTTRRVAAWAHDLVGLGFPLALLWHIWRGRRSLRSRFQSPSPRHR